MTTPVGKKCHSALHKLKRRKNLLAIAIAVANSSPAKHAATQSHRALLRREYRILHLADCYMRGRTYRQVEPVHDKWPSNLWKRVKETVIQYNGPIVPMPPVDEWIMAN